MYQSIASDVELERQFKYRMPENIKALFPNSTELEFDIKKAYKTSMGNGDRPINAIEELSDSIEYQVKQYTYCICKSSDSYLKWLKDEFKRKLSLKLTQEYNKYMFE